MSLNKGILSYFKRAKEELTGYEKYSDSYIELYEEVYGNDLGMLLSSYHAWLNSMFDYMNERIPYRYFHADDSREAIDLFNRIDKLLSILSREGLKLTESYKIKIKEIERFISALRGTEVPEEFEKINIIEVYSAFESSQNLLLKKDKKVVLKPIGEGSYAKVFKYYDEDYQKEFVLKKALESLTEKELIRFKKEFDIMKSLRSPYVTEVYKYIEVDNSYSMELMDSTLYEYLKKNNQYLTLKDRCYIVNQIIRGFKHLINNEILHRDISPKNILINDYGDIKVVKISDFGLVKIKESQLTAPDTEFKGSLNDPNLIIEGFKNYSEAHEMYALTYLISIVISGKFNISKIEVEAIKEFINKGMSGLMEERFQTIDELYKGYLDMKKELEKMKI